MTHEPPPVDPDDPRERALDELLARASWPRMNAAAEGRLRRAWRGAFDRPRRIVPALAGLAALLALALAGWVWLGPAAPVRQVVRPPVEEVDPTEPVAEAQPVPARPRLAVREPTPFERLLVAPPRQPAPRAASAPAPPVPLPVNPQEQARRQMLALLRSHDPRDHDRFLQLVLDPASRPLAIEALRQMPEPPVDALLRQLGNPHMNRRLAAARALGEICQPELVEHLWRMVAHNVHRREALAALTQCHQPQAGRYLALAYENRSLESQLRTIRAQLNEIF